MNSAPLSSRNGRLEIRQVTLDDSGEYTCVGRNLLGKTNKTARMIVKGNVKRLIVLLLPFKIDQNKNKNKSPESEERKQVQVKAIFLMRDMRRNVLPKFIEISTESA